MINDQVNGQQLLRFPGAIVPEQPARSVAGRDHLQRLRGANSRRQRADGFRRRADDHQLVVPSRSDPGFERGRLVRRECEHRLRSQRRGRLADQLSVSIGKHERFRAAGQSGLAARSAGQSGRPHACRQQRFVQFAARRGQSPLRRTSNTAPTRGPTAWANRRLWRRR